MKLAFWEKAAGSFCYIGFRCKGPGTVTSAIVFAGAWFISNKNILWGALLLLLPLSFYLAYRFEKIIGHDPSGFTLDEVIGSLIVLCCIQHIIWQYLAFFIIWRLLDIFKPFFKKAEQIPWGIGIMADDIIGGFVTAGIWYGYGLFK